MAIMPAPNIIAVCCDLDRAKEIRSGNILMCSLLHNNNNNWAKVLVQETRAWDGKGANAACRVGANQDGFLHGMPCDSHDGVVVPAGHPSGLGGRRPQNLHETIRGVDQATFKWGGLRPEPAASSDSRER